MADRKKAPALKFAAMSCSKTYIEVHFEDRWELSITGPDRAFQSCVNHTLTTAHICAFKLTPK